MEVKKLYDNSSHGKAAFFFFFFYFYWESRPLCLSLVLLEIEMLLKCTAPELLLALPYITENKGLKPKFSKVANKISLIACLGYSATAWYFLKDGCHRVGGLCPL